MALVHLRLSEHAALSIIDAVRSYRLERKRKTGSPDAARLIHALRDTHLGLEKLIKAGLARQDETLLIERPTAPLLQSIRAEMIARGASSMLVLGQQIQTLSAESAWKACEVVYKTTLDPTLSEAFGSALSRLGYLRNAARHAELYADSEDILAAVERSLAKVREVAEVICPEVMAKIQQQSASALDELRGIEQNVDGSWLVIAEFLSGGNSVDLEFEMHVTLDPQTNVAGISLNRRSTRKVSLLEAVQLEHGLDIFTNLERRDEMGLFGRVVSRAESVARRAQMEDQLPPIPEDFPQVSPKSPTLPSLFADADSVRALAAAFGANRERRANYIAVTGLPVLEAGDLALTNVVANLRIVIPHGDELTSKSTDVFFTGRFRIGEKEQQGGLEGELQPLIRGAETRPAPIKARGAFWLTNELVVEEANEVFSAGTVIRYFKGRLTLSR